MTGVFCFAVVGLSDGDIHHVQGPHWEEREISADWVAMSMVQNRWAAPLRGPSSLSTHVTSYGHRGVVGHEHGPEQVSGPPKAWAPSTHMTSHWEKGGCWPWHVQEQWAPASGPSGGSSAPTWHHTGRGGRWGRVSPLTKINWSAADPFFLHWNPRGLLPSLELFIHYSSFLCVCWTGYSLPSPSFQYWLKYTLSTTLL